MPILIGHASISEDGTMYGKQMGDQTGKEVCIRTFWKDDWTILRLQDKVLRQRMADAMKELCNNDNAGYNASTKQRQSGILLLSKYGSIADIKELFSVDCSSAIRLCLKQCGINLPNFTTKSEEKTLLGCGYFLPAFKFEKESDLEIGDILVKAGHHTIVVVDRGNVETPKQKKVSKLMRFLGG